MTIAELSIVLGVASIICSFIIPLWQERRNRKNSVNRIDHVFINSYNIGKGLTSKFPEFSLTFKGKPILNDVRVLHGKFTNTGRNDIDAFNGKSDIKLILPSSCSIMKITAYPSTDEITIIPQKNKSGNVAIFGIKEFMRPKEYFIYTIIFEEKYDINDIQDQLEFYQRIKGTNGIIKNSDYKQGVNFFKCLRYFVNICYLAFSLLIVYSLIDFFPNLDRKPLVILFIIIGIIIWAMFILINNLLTKLLMCYFKRRHHIS